MLDTIIKLAAEALQITTAEVNQAREQLLAEQATADARYAVTSALLHPEGSTTPISEAYSRAQVRYADLRSKLIADLPAMFSLMMAVSVAEQRRDEADKHRELKWNAEWEHAKAGVHQAVRDWWLRLHKHGVHPHHLKQHSNETVAIIADLIAWKAKNPTFDDPNNPWVAVLQIYAGRKITKPTRQIRATLSTPGTPEKARHIGGAEDYSFGTVAPLPTLDEEASADQPGASEPAEGVGEAGDDNIAGPAVAETVAETADSGDEPAELALISGMSAEAFTTLQQAAESLVDSDNDWKYDLDYEVGKGGSTGEIIERVERIADPGIPFKDFVMAARTGGIEAGRKAYRMAVVRQNMLMIATDPSWSAVRRQLGLE